MRRSRFIAAFAFAIVFTLTCAFTWVQPALAAEPGKAGASEALAALADTYYEAQARLDPLYSATLTGDNRFDDQLPITISPAHRKKRFAMYHHVQRQLAAINREGL